MDFWNFPGKMVGTDFSLSLKCRLQILVLSLTVSGRLMPHGQSLEGVCVCVSTYSITMAGLARVGAIALPFKPRGAQVFL